MGKELFETQIIARYLKLFAHIFWLLFFGHNIDNLVTHIKNAYLKSATYSKNCTPYLVIGKVSANNHFLRLFYMLHS